MSDPKDLYSNDQPHEPATAVRDGRHLMNAAACMSPGCGAQREEGWNYCAACLEAYR